MERKTLDIFASTSNYLKYLIEEIITSNVEIPTETIITINDLMVKLFSFMNYLYKNESKAGKTMVGGQYLGRNDNNLLINSCRPVESLPTYSSQAGYIDSSQSYKFNHVHPQAKVNAKSEPMKPTAFSSQTSQVVIRSKADGPVAPSTQQVHQKIVKPLNPKPATVTNSKPAAVTNSKPATVTNSKPATVTNSKPAAVTKSKTVTPAKPTVNNTKSDTPAGNSKSLNASSKTDVFITKLYSKHTDNILSGRVDSKNMGIYCRSCDALCKTSWSLHVTEVTHIENNQNIKKLKMYTCRICKMCVYGSAKLIKKYFDYHFLKIHEPARISCEESMEEVRCEATNINRSTSSSISSLNRAVDDFPENPSIVLGNETSQVIGVASSTDSASQSSKNELLGSPLSVPRGSEILVKTAPSKPDSLVKTAPSKPIPHITSPYPDFDRIISVMLKNWNENCLRVDAGYCTICQLGIESGFEWFSHVDDHGSKDPSIREEICPFCNVKIYGSEHKKYLNLASHIELDRKISGIKAAK